MLSVCVCGDGYDLRMDLESATRDRTNARWDERVFN